MFAKQLIYLTNDNLTAYRWEHGNLSAGPAFHNDEAGWEGFLHHLAGKGNTPLYLLADLIEEDFQRDSVPHVLGNARRMLVQRRLGQLYRDTPYRQAMRQGREDQGRRDDRMLFSALTNADLLKPWLGAILKQKAPLAGIYSPALLSAALVKKLGWGRNHLLLVTRQSGGLRQSYFQGEALKFSRLTPLADQSSAAVADAVAAESAKTQQFLASTRLLPRGELMDVAILAHDEDLRQIQNLCQDGPALAYRFLDLEDVARTLGLRRPSGKDAATWPTCDALFLFLLGRNPLAHHYDAPEQTRFFKLWQARIALYGMSFAALAGSLAWAGSNSLDAMEYLQQGHQMAMEIRALQARYQTLAGSMPATAANPQVMKAAVNIEQMIARNGPEPAALLAIVSRALDAHPQMRIEQLQWQAGMGETADPAAPPVPPIAGGAEPPLPAALAGIPGKPDQTLLIEGEVLPFKQDYRTALEIVRQFADELGKNRQMKVEIIRSPLDISPGARLEGKSGAGEEGAKARFSLKLVLRAGA